MPIKRIVDKCSKQFQSKNQLSNHQLLVHMPKEMSEHRCNKCGKVFQAAAFLQTHLCNRSGQRDHECQTCKTRFTTSSSLKMHVGIHFHVLKRGKLYSDRDNESASSSQFAEYVSDAE